MGETAELLCLAGELGVDLFGVADLKRSAGIPFGGGGDPVERGEEILDIRLRLMILKSEPMREHEG
jgi:hypothetical protein